MAQALDELIEWYFWPADEYGTCDGFTPDALELRRRGDCVDVTGYVSVMYYDVPDERWDDSLETLLKGHERAYLERPFSAELRYEGQSVVHLAAASEEVPWDLCQRLVPTLVGDFVGRCAREIRF